MPLSFAASSYSLLVVLTSLPCWPIFAFHQNPSDTKRSAGGQIKKTSTLNGADFMESSFNAGDLLSKEPFLLDNRPYAARARQPRAARRLNHAFKYLYRHRECSHQENDPLQYLKAEVNFTDDEVKDMAEQFPPLLSLDVKRHVQPKLLFAKETLGVEDFRTLPPHFYGSRLERIVAPRHAFLVYKNLQHGKELDLSHFLAACRTPKRFAAFCNQLGSNESSEALSGQRTKTEVKEVEAFDAIFQRGLMPAARNELVQSNNTWPLDHLNVSSGQMIDLLIRHGANPLERDASGATLLHWAAGTGNLNAVKVLLPLMEHGIWTEAERDGATALHWAAAGANSREFGIGGHSEVFKFLLQVVQDKKKLVNKLTKDGNSVLHWAAWSGTLESVKLAVRNRACLDAANRNGCTVAHWAASGGDLPTCRYLYEVCGVDFVSPNYGGNTPLTHAVAFGRVQVVEWLREEVVHDDDSVAAHLASQFVDWTDGDERRHQVLELFRDMFA